MSLRSSLLMSSCKTKHTRVTILKLNLFYWNLLSICSSDQNYEVPKEHHRPCQLYFIFTLICYFPLHYLTLHSIWIKHCPTQFSFLYKCCAMFLSKDFHILANFIYIANRHIETISYQTIYFIPIVYLENTIERRHLVVNSTFCDKKSLIPLILTFISSCLFYLSTLPFCTSQL